MKNKSHNSYKTHVWHRTRCLYTTPCPQCIIERKNIRKEHIKNYKFEGKNFIKGFKTEQYINDLLNKFPETFQSELIGKRNCDTDCIVTLNNGDKKCLQVKTLVLSPEKDSYYTGDLIYERNILIAMVNEERDRFVLAFSHDFKANRRRFNFSDKKFEQNIMYNNENIFIDQLIKMIPLSVNYDDSIILSRHRKELESFRRLKLWCENKNLELTENENSASTVDCFINGITVQMKYSNNTTNNGNTFHVDIKKGAGTRKGTQITRPYEFNDFEILVIEIGGTHEKADLYHGKFMFLTQYDLIYYQFLKTNKTDGKIRMTVYNPDFPEDYWCKSYWNEESFLEIIDNWDEYKFEQIKNLDMIEKYIDDKEIIQNEDDIENDIVYDFRYENKEIESDSMSILVSSVPSKPIIKIKSDLPDHPPKVIYKIKPLPLSLPES
jgi:hypothetical protein